MQPPNRRQFLVRSGMALGLASKVIHPDSLTSALEEPQGPAAGSGIERPGQLSGSHAPLYNKNLRTAIGLGDEPAGIVDKFGQVLRSRNAALRIELGSPLQPAEKVEWSQSLLDGYLPIVETHISAGKASLHLSAFSSEYGDVKADYIGIRDGKNPYRIRLLFPIQPRSKLTGER